MDSAEDLKKQFMKNEIKELKKRNRYLEQQVKHYKNKSEKLNEMEMLEVEANKTVLKTKLDIDEFLKEVAITPLRTGAIAKSSEGTKQKLSEGIDELENFCREMRAALKGRIDISE